MLSLHIDILRTLPQYLDYTSLRSLAVTCSTLHNLYFTYIAPKRKFIQTMFDGVTTSQEMLPLSNGKFHTMTAGKRTYKSRFTDHITSLENKLVIELLINNNRKLIIGVTQIQPIYISIKHRNYTSIITCCGDVMMRGHLINGYLIKKSKLTRLVEILIQQLKDDLNLSIDPITCVGYIRPTHSSIPDDYLQSYINILREVCES